MGDVLLACATLTYCGAMPHDRQVKLVQSWQQECQSRDIVTSQPFTVAGVLSRPTEVSLAPHMLAYGLTADPGPTPVPAEAARIPFLPGARQESCSSLCCSMAWHRGIEAWMPTSHKADPLLCRAGA